METLLLTGTIKPNKEIVKIWYTHNINSEIRYKTYLDNIIFYLTKTNFSNIVFCENSNYPIKDIKLLEDTAFKYNKKIEILQFSWNEELTLKYGYWYWEAEILDYAFENSILIKNSKNWYKLSWRYLLINSNDIINSYKNDNIYLFKLFRFAFFSICTAFFKINNDFFEKNFYKKWIEYYNQYFKTSQKKTSIERIWYCLAKDKLFKNKTTKTKIIPKFNFDTPQIIIFQKIKRYLGLFDFWIVAKALDKQYFMKRHWCNNK